MSKAILVASFGTSYGETCSKNIGAVETAIGAAFPGWEIRRAFTSSMIIRKLRERDSVETDTVEQALERLAGQGYSQVVVQPTHLINGIEYAKVAASIGSWAQRFGGFAVGEPLLTTTEDYRGLADILSGLFPRRQDTVLCLMGHGSTHYADTAYAALEYHFRDRGRPDVLVGTVEGFPDLDTLLRHAGETGASRAVLTPLMLVAGDHALNDLAGPGEDSWKSAFQGAGYEVECVLKGLGEYEAVRRLYVDHARAAMELLSQQ